MTFPVPKTLRDGTDCHRLFLALRDGQPHTHHELYRLGMIVHSRKSDLVHRHGCVIDVWSEGGTSFYQLRAARREEAQQRDGGKLPLDGPSDGPGSAEPASPSPGPPSTPAADPALQLLIWEAA